MNKPTSIKIGHLDYAIAWVDDKWVLENDRTGEVSFIKQEIRVAETLCNAKKADTFQHEIIHALFHHYERNIETPIERERAAEIIAAGLVMIWRDNPDVFAWWSGLLNT